MNALQRGRAGTNRKEASDSPLSPSSFTPGSVFRILTTSVEEAPEAPEEEEEASWVEGDGADCILVSRIRIE
ncbi:hypothetical protein cyc_01902 [Cyclospora cayetanensis]|uniref:Uncharacterized protein n=1 Tax=Cyclospora cayetanensis TaxID=88456 RepID=A0A1D3CSQ7_9EIME|nr:hypothetical protein cyc_01902 [Cyclospora cayetanensis]